MSKASLADRFRTVFRDWAVPRQLAGEDPQGSAAQSDLSRTLRPRLEEADRVGTSICPYCAVGCAQLIYAKGNDVIHIEGDPRSPINQGTLCPKGAAAVGWMLNQSSDQSEIPRSLLRSLGRASTRLGDGSDRPSRKAHAR